MPEVKTECVLSKKVRGSHKTSVLNIDKKMIPKIHKTQKQNIPLSPQNVSSPKSSNQNPIQCIGLYKNWWTQHNLPEGTVGAVMFGTNREGIV